MDRPLDVGARTRSPEFEDTRSAERWTETLEAWVARLDLCAHIEDYDRLLSLVETEVGQNDAWYKLAYVANTLERQALVVDELRTAARDAILAIPEPTDD